MMNFYLKGFSLTVVLALTGLAYPQVLHKAGVLRNQNTLTAGNGFYEVVVEGFIDSGVGLYSVRTDSLHPITQQFGEPQDLLLGAKRGLAGSSYLTVRSYTARTDYVQTEHARADSGFHLVWLDSTLITETDIAEESTFFQPIIRGDQTTGYRVKYTLPRFDLDPEMTIAQTVEVHGTRFEDSWVEVTTVVTNESDASCEIGIRYLWDLAVGQDDGPKVRRTLFNQEFGDFETRLLEPKFAFFAAESNMLESAAEYEVQGSVITPASMNRAELQPERLQLVSWPLAFFRAFDYAIHDSLDVSTSADPNAGITDGDNAIQFFWGDSSEEPLVIAPGDSVRVTQALRAGDFSRIDRRRRPTCQLISSSDGAEFRVQDDDCGLHSIKILNSRNAEVNIPNFEKGAIEPIVVSAKPVNASQSFGLTFRVLNLCGISVTCDPVFLTLDAAQAGREYNLQPLASDRYFYIENQGLERIDVILNEQAFSLVTQPDAALQTANTFRMPAFGELTIDIVDYLQDNNFMTVSFSGPEGSRANLILADFLVTGQVDFRLSLEPVPDNFALSQNLPNPFRATTRIQFEVPAFEASIPEIGLQIYNILGQRVRTLVSDVGQPGTYTVSWDGRDDHGRPVAAGVYLYTLNANGRRLTNKMMLLR